MEKGFGFIRVNLFIRVCVWITWIILSIILIIPAIIYLGIKRMMDRESHIRPLREYFKREVSNFKAIREFMKTGIMYYV